MAHLWMEEAANEWVVVLLERDALALDAVPPRRLAANGAAEEVGDALRIEGGKSVRLAPRLSAFLRILAADEPYGDGPLVGWKSKSEVARRMEKQFGLQFHPHTLDTLTYRLRSALESIGEPPGLVQADRRWGMRFALQRGGLTVTERLAS